MLHIYNCEGLIFPVKKEFVSWNSRFPIFLEDKRLFENYGEIAKKGNTIFFLEYGISLSEKDFSTIMSNKDSTFKDILKVSKNVIMMTTNYKEAESLAKSKNLPFGWLKDNTYFVVQPYSDNIFLYKLQVVEPNNPFF